MTTSIQTSLDLGTVLPRLERNDHNAAGMLLQQPPSISLSPQLVARFYSNGTQVTHEQLDEVGVGVLHLWDHAAENLVERCGDGTTIKLKMRNAGVLVGLDVVGCQVSLGVDKRGGPTQPGAGAGDYRPQPQPPRHQHCPPPGPGRAALADPLRADP